MTCTIRVIASPCESALPHMREGWVGLVLETVSAGNGNIEPEYQKTGGYYVERDAVIWALSDSKHEPAARYLESLPGDLFWLSSDICERVPKSTTAH